MLRNDVQPRFKRRSCCKNDELSKTTLNLGPSRRWSTICWVYCWIGDFHASNNLQNINICGSLSQRMLVWPVAARRFEWWMAPATVVNTERWGRETLRPDTKARTWEIFRSARQIPKVVMIMGCKYVATLMDIVWHPMMDGPIFRPANVELPKSVRSPSCRIPSEKNNVGI